MTPEVWTYPPDPEKWSKMHVFSQPKYGIFRQTAQKPHCFALSFARKSAKSAKTVIFCPGIWHRGGVLTAGAQNHGFSGFFQQKIRKTRARP